MQSKVKIFELTGKKIPIEYFQQATYSITFSISGQKGISHKQGKDEANHYKPKYTFVN